MAPVADSRGIRVDVSTRFMVDISLLLTDAGATWIEESEYARSAAFVSAAFYEALREPSEAMLLRFADPEQRDFVRLAREVLPSRLEAVEKFSHQSIPRLPGRQEDVRQRLLAVGGLEGEILADEFVYLVSNSWLLAKTRRLIDELKRAGARVVEYVGEHGEPLLRQVIAQVIPEEKLPKELTQEVIAKAGVKWVIVGGTKVGLLHAPPVAKLAGHLVKPLLKAFDP
jgi:hypothetical protein